MSQKIKVSHTWEIPNHGSKIVLAQDKYIALFRIDEKIYAMDNTCPHRGGPLGEGALQGHIVTCPWHGWQFDICTGQLAMGGDGVAIYPIEIIGEEVYLLIK